MSFVLWTARTVATCVTLSGMAVACGGGSGDVRALPPSPPAPSVDEPVSWLPNADAFHQDSGLGNDGGAGQSENGGAAPQVASAAGNLAPETIQAVVRTSYGEFRKCYETGLQTTPKLSGRIAVRLVIRPDGRVTSATDGGSDMPHRGVVRCVIDRMRRLRFPKHAGEDVRVVYPITFAPGD